MSQGELVNAFLEGRVSRRTLIRRLVAGGVSMGAAVSYAHLLAPEPARASPSLNSLGDFYPLVDMTLVPRSLSNIESGAGVSADVSSTEEIKTISFRAFLQRTAGLSSLGRKDLSNYLAGPGTRRTFIPIDTAPLAGRDAARIRVYAQGVDNENRIFAAVAKRRFVR